MLSVPFVVGYDECACEAHVDLLPLLSSSNFWYFHCTAIFFLAFDILAILSPFFYLEIHYLFDAKSVELIKI